MFRSSWVALRNKPLEEVERILGQWASEARYWANKRESGPVGKQLIREADFLELCHERAVLSVTRRARLGARSLDTLLADSGGPVTKPPRL